MQSGGAQAPIKEAAERKQARGGTTQRQRARAVAGRAGIKGRANSSANQNLPLAENIRVMPLIWVARRRWPGWSTDHRNTGLYSFWPFLLNC